ncbi:hypothetical protein EJB05_23063, partial [Eragrostis curvula]
MTETNLVKKSENISSLHYIESGNSASKFRLTSFPLPPKILQKKLMDLAISSVASDLASRFISFLINKFSAGSSCSEEIVQRLHHLLLRVQMVVEEADGRYITNGAMLLQLKLLEEAMYGGYYALHNFKYRHIKGAAEEVSEGSCSLYFTTPLKRFQRSGSFSANYDKDHKIESALVNLEAAVYSMTEFVILLGRCERMSRRPYDTYLYMETFMFGRHAEKQQAINILLQHSLPNNNAPIVLPIIGGRLIGKKTLVAHVCNDERVRAHFSIVLHLNSDNFLGVDPALYTTGRTLVIVEFTSDVRDEDWTKFYSSVGQMGRESKVILITRIESLSRFGTVKPICLNNMSFEEYSYLFRVLAFGSTNMDDHPHLASMADEFPMLLRGSLVSVYAFADALRKNMNARFWLSVLERARAVVESNLSVFGEHPKLLLERDRPTDITRFVSPSSAPLCLMPPRCEADATERPLPTVTFRELIVDPRVLPSGDFDLVTWESRIAPYTKYVHFVPAACVEKHPATLPTSRKRPAVFLSAHTTASERRHTSKVAQGHGPCCIGMEKWVKKFNGGSFCCSGLWRQISDKI